MTTSPLNNDAGETVFFARQLEHVKAKTYDIVKAPLKAFELIPVDSTVDNGAESIVYMQYDMTGIAKVIANYADDLPRADVQGKEYVARVRSIGNSYGYSVQEIRAAQKAGMPLPQRKNAAAVRAQRELWNKIAFYGDAEYNIPGWLTNANIPSASATADGTGSTTTWSTKTPAQILRDLNQMANSIVTLTKGAETPDTIVLPLTAHTLISSTVFGTASDDTILDVFLKNSPFIKNVEWANELESASLAAAGITDFTGNIGIAYRKSADTFNFEMPQMFEQFPEQWRGLEAIVPCHSRVAGVLVYYPLSMYILEGI